MSLLAADHHKIRRELPSIIAKLNKASDLVVWVWRCLCDLNVVCSTDVQFGLRQQLVILLRTTVMRRGRFSGIRIQPIHCH